MSLADCYKVLRARGLTARQAHTGAKILLQAAEGWGEVPEQLVASVVVSMRREVR